MNGSIIEQAVKLLCEKSQRPHDDFDVIAMKLGAFADEYNAMVSGNHPSLKVVAVE